MGDNLIDQEADEIFSPTPVKPNGRDTSVQLDTQTPIPTSKATTPQFNKFRGVSAKTAAAAKKGGQSSSQTGRARQTNVELEKPKSGMFVRVHPSSNYRICNLPTYYDERTKFFYFIQPDLYESDDLPARFKRACKLIDVFAAAYADGTFFLWYVNVSTSQWRKSAIRVIQHAQEKWITVYSDQVHNQYRTEEADVVIPDPKWEKLGPFEKALEGAFEGTIFMADDEVINKFMSGGYDEEAEE
jgi:hypothetical protein